jgi:GTP-binding protein
MSKAEQVKCGKFIEDYLEKRESISVVVMVVDIRHKPTADDQMMYDYILKTNLPFMIITNKADKIAITKVDNEVNRIKDFFGISYTTILPFSSERKIYQDRVWEEIEKYIK